MDSIPHPDACLRAAVECVCFNLRKTTRAVTSLYDEALRGTGLRVTQLSLLNAMYLAGPAPVSVLADVLVIDRTTLTRNLASLEQRGLVQGKAGDDRRVRLVELTPNGVDLLARAMPAWEQAQNDMVGRLGPGRWEDFVAELAAVSSLVREDAQAPQEGDGEGAHRAAEEADRKEQNDGS
jgi:DNA-binding MarR family transcriptional regulator